MTLSARDIVCLVLYFIFLTTISIWDISFQYIVLIAALIMILWMVVLRGKWPKFIFVDLFALLPLFIWLYGVSIGVLNSNNNLGIVRNFAGMLFYLVYFFMVFSSISRSKLLAILIKASIIYLIIALMLGVNSFINGNLVSFDEYGTSSIRFYFSVGQSILIPTLFIYLCGSSHFFRSDFDRMEIVKRSRIIILAIIISLIFSGGKGYYLELGVLASIFFFLFIIRFIKKLKIDLKSFFLLMILVTLGIYILPEITNAFSSLIFMEFDDSHPRVIQGKALMGDFTLFGKGLGGVIPDYSRDALGYGFELSFYNIVHKFGIFSVFIFASYLAPIFYSLNEIFYRTSKIYSYLPLIFMLYLIPAFANPSIFAPVCVIMHCIALYFIRSNISEETKNV